MEVNLHVADGAWHRLLCRRLQLADHVEELVNSSDWEPALLRSRGWSSVSSQPGTAAKSESTPKTTRAACLACGLPMAASCSPPARPRTMSLKAARLRGCACAQSISRRFPTLSDESCSGWVLKSTQPSSMRDSPALMGATADALLQMTDDHTVVQQQLQRAARSASTATPSLQLRPPIGEAEFGSWKDTSTSMKYCAPLPQLLDALPSCYCTAPHLVMSCFDPGLVDSETLMRTVRESMLRGAPKDAIDECGLGHLEFGQT